MQKIFDEAIAESERSKPFLVIQDLDLGLDSKHGLDVIECLKKLKFAGRICVHSNRFLFEDQKAAFAAGADSVLPKPMSRIQLLKLISFSLPNFDQAAQKEPPSIKKIKLAFLDDTKTFTVVWKMKLKSFLDIETFSSSSEFLKRVTSDSSFLKSFDVIVTDYHFAPGDLHTGKTLAAELRALGLMAPIYLASNGEFTAEELLPNIQGAISKEPPNLEVIESWLQKGR